MSGRFRTLLDKVARQRGTPLPMLLRRAVGFAGSRASAAALAATCDAVGPGARSIGGRPLVKNEGTIRVGRDVVLNNRYAQVELATGPGGELVIGDGVAINYGTLVSADARVTIGDRVMIGNHCIVADTEVPGTRAPSDAPRPVSIGDGVWLAVRVTVLPGVTIGTGTVVTAGSVVASDLPPGVVAGGIPARVLRRATPDQSPSRESGVNGTAAATPGSAPAVAPPPKEQRGLLISDFTIDELARQLDALPDRPGIGAEVAPFGQVVPQLMQGVPASAADFAVVWTNPESAVPAFARILAFEPVPQDVLLAEVDRFSELVASGCAACRAVFVPTWTRPTYDRGLGLLDAREGGVGRALLAMNARLMDNLARSKNVFVLDAQRWLFAGGKNATSPKLWYLGKVPFHAEVFAEAARDVQAALRALRGEAKKLVVVDLDDTLWGGIVGDAGWENLRLGGHDGLGEAFVDFQRALRDLRRRGVVLGIVSKNEEDVALEAIKMHPEMVLREGDFVGWRINWRDKAQNIVELTNELNLGLQSVVFIDDNPVERARVRESLPEVFVPEWPEDKHLYKSALLAMRCFDTPHLSREDVDRTSLYASERKREQLHASVGSIDEWLKSLNMKVKVEPLAAANLQRTAQLLNKTNQMNLSTRRLTDSELMAWASGQGRRLWAVSVSDRFGDAGLTGILSAQADGTRVHIVDFVLSCRVMGRKVEDTMVHIAVEHARKTGAREVTARFVPTAKNKPCLTFWRASGFSLGADDSFVWDAARPYDLPGAIQLEWEP